MFNKCQTSQTNLLIHQYVIFDKKKETKISIDIVIATKFKDEDEEFNNLVDAICYVMKSSLYQFEILHSL